jgi:hypothetical protein
MAQILVSNQSPRTVTTFMNQSGRVGDPAPGVPLSTAQVSGSIVQSYAGMLGQKLTLSNAEATTEADPSVGPLYGGIYQYVRFLATSVASPVRGQLVYWSDRTNYVVTPDYAAALAGQIAGVALNGTAKGNYDWIQIAGDAMVRFGTITGAGTIGDQITMLAANNVADDPLQATAFTPAVAKTVIGTAVRTAPASNTVSPVCLNLVAGWEY